MIERGNNTAQSESSSMCQSEVQICADRALNKHLYYPTQQNTSSRRRIWSIALKCDEALGSRKEQVPRNGYKLEFSFMRMIPIST